MASFQFIHNFPEHPAARTFEVDGQQVTSATISVRRVLNKAGSRDLLIVTQETPAPVNLWTDDEYDAQAAGAGFGQAEIEARIDEVLAAI